VPSNLTAARLRARVDASDVLGTGLSAKPSPTPIFSASRFGQKKQIAAESFIEANPAAGRRRRARLWQPHGNSTVNGAVYFDDDISAIHWCFAAAWESFPETRLKNNRAATTALVVMGGRDRPRWNSWSYVQLSGIDRHARGRIQPRGADGNAITQKKMADVILAARDRQLFTAVTDCGAEIAHAIGRGGEKLRRQRRTRQSALKYAGLRYRQSGSAKLRNAWCFPFRTNTSLNC